MKEANKPENMVSEGVEHIRGFSENLSSLNPLSSSGMLTIGTAVFVGVLVIRNTPLKRLFSGKILGSLVSKKTLGLGVFMALTGGILVVTNQLKPASSTMDHSGHGEMSHDEMMAVDGSFNPTPVTVEVVKPQLLEAKVQYTGTIEPYQVVTVYPRVAGQLTNYSVYPGDRITTGQTLAQISASELFTEVAEAQAETDTMRTALEVSKIEILEQKNNIKQIEADLGYLNKKLERFSMLVSQGAIAQDDYDVVESEVQAKQAMLSEARVKIARLEAKVINDQAKVQQAKAKVATASVISSYTQIEAPVTGIVQERIVDPGMVVQPGMGILKIGDYSQIRLQANVAQHDATKIRIGTPIVAKIPGTSLTINGQVSSIFPQSNSQTRTVTVEAVVNNPGGELRSGQFVEMELITQRQTNALTVPSSAVVTFEDNPAVWVVNGETATRKLVTLGMISGDNIQILRGLQPGDAVITTGHYKLIENAAVTVINQNQNSLISSNIRNDQNNVSINLVSFPEVKIGDAEFIFEIIDSTTKKPLQVKELDIKATMPMKNMPPMTAKVEVKLESQTGKFKAETFLGMKGEWKISVDVKDENYQGKKEFNILVK
ncbi:efflux RND transporter periplasmic adaptor subunit [Crocosphaera chwakensis]|uniref:Efflux transporter, RND family, MFP subunit n=1 Tax=Crocosphaera chwakensis CCY0110 TaxID=391612 RepID=A3ITP2_9CHRO|nr:efflux RND transporter periplasmic adaptor subunit [Crocosphaera chwakensis]EAZ90108.1 efflux transporter, RND family, MFP subunit [Crocosphaera chwakensis CCY0110]